MSEQRHTIPKCYSRRATNCAAFLLCALAGLVTAATFGPVPGPTKNARALSAAIFPAPTKFLVLPSPAPSVTAIAPVGSRASVTLVWDASPDATVVGYRVYWGAASGAYTNSIDVGNKLKTTIGGLIEGVTYYFAATAYDTNLVESVFSNVATSTTAFLVSMRPVAYSIEGYGRTGATNVFESSTNLTNWTERKVFKGTGALTNFVWWSTNAPQAFFRIKTKLGTVVTSPTNGQRLTISRTNTGAGRFYRVLLP